VAKNRLSELVDEACAHGPQVITRRGRNAAVVVGYDDFLELSGRRAPRRSFKQHDAFLAISVLTLGELEKGVALLPTGFAQA
jgi:prevent-host-death family protein